MTDGGYCNIPDAFLKKRGDKKHEAFHSLSVAIFRERGYDDRKIPPMQQPLKRSSMACTFGFLFFTEFIKILAKQSTGDDLKSAGYIAKVGYRLSWVQKKESWLLGPSLFPVKISNDRFNVNHFQFV